MNVDAKFLLDLFQWLFMGALAVLMWARKPGEAAGKDVANILVEMARMQARLDMQEGSVLQALKVQERRLERLEDFFMANFKGDGK